MYESHEDVSEEIKENFPPITISIILPLVMIITLLWLFVLGA
jgi:hypothetical protein